MDTFEKILSQSREATTVGGVFTKLQQTAVQAHAWHLQTRSYAEHMALGMYYEALPPLLDSLMEGWLAESSATLNVKSIKLEDYNGNPTPYFEEVRDWMKTGLRFSIPAGRTDMMNIADEMLALVNKLIYLLKLK